MRYATFIVGLLFLIIGGCVIAATREPEKFSGLDEFKEREKRYWESKNTDYME